MTRVRRSEVWWLVAGFVLLFSAGAIVAVHSAVAQPMTSQPAEDDEPADADSQVADSGFLRKLTKPEINRIRFLELRAMRLSASEQPDRVTVKVPQAVVDEFLLDMQGEPDFSNDAARREFRKLTPPQKLHIIAKRRADAFAEKVEIQTDPEVFVEFRKQVMPTILRGCATAGCHSPGDEETARFSLFKDPKKSPSTTYANFILLTELVGNDYPVINRAQPENSVLLTYMLPTKDVKPAMRHPGKEELKPIYQSRSAQGFRRIERWIASLKHPQGDYRVRLLPERETPANETAAPPTTQPRDQSQEP